MSYGINATSFNLVLHGKGWSYENRPEQEMDKVGSALQKVGLCVGCSHARLESRKGKHISKPYALYVQLELCHEDEE